MGIAVNGAIQRAVEELVTERDHLRARLGKVEQLIVSMREAFHLPAEKERALKGSRVKRATRNQSQTERVRERIVEALKRGPLSPGDLSSALGLERAFVRRYAADMEAEGLLVATGTTASRRIALPSKTAKEAP